MSQTEKPQKTYGPYSIVAEAGPFVFVSGQVGIDPETGTANPDVAVQTDQAIRNLASALDTVGLELSDVVDTTVFVTDMGDFATVNDVYAQHFTPPYPARACVAAAELPRVGGEVALQVEIKAIALKRL